MNNYWQEYYNKLDACKTQVEIERLRDDEYYREEAKLYAEHGSAPPDRPQQKMTTGAHVKDQAGRIGIITEIREDGCFIRPMDIPYKIDDLQGLTGVDHAIILTPTFWNQQPDGSLRGLWWDSAPNAFTSCRMTNL